MSYNTYPQNPFPPNSENAGGGGSSYELPIASTTELGGVKVGSGLAINAETGVLINNYNLPTATPETLGGVITDTTSGLFNAAGEIGVNLKQNGGLHFTEQGELFADNWTPPSFTTTESESGLHLGEKAIYQKVLTFEQAVSLTSNAWVNLNVDVNAETCFLAIAIADDGTSVPLCFANDSSVGLQVLNMRTSTISFKKFIVMYTKATT